MLTKAVITSIIDKYSAKVRIPSIHKVTGATYAYSDSELPTATICTAAGNAPALQVGDIVFVDFEDDLEQQPVILGWLYKDGSTTRANIDAASISANVKCELPKQTSIGSINEDDINHIKNTSGNIQGQLDLLNNSSNDLQKQIDTAKVRITKLENNIDFNHIQLSATTFSNRGCSTFTTDDTTGITTCIAPAGSNSWGYGITFSEAIVFNPGETLVFAIDVNPTVDCVCNSDINNATSDGKNPGGNDNDDGSLRFYDNKNLVANTWQTYYFTQTAKWNVNYYLKNASSNWGIVTTGTSDITFYIRNVRYAVIGNTTK